MPPAAGVHKFNLESVEVEAHTRSTTPLVIGFVDEAHE